MIAFAILVAALPASGTPKPVKEHVASPVIARPVGASYASCVWQRQKPQVRAALDRQMSNDAKLYEGLHLESCFGFTGGTITLSPFVLRGLLYEAMYRDDFGRSPVVSSFSDVAPVSYPVAPTSDRSEIAKNYRGLMRIADCAIRAAPVEARMLLKTALASKAEARVIVDFTPTLDKCQLPAQRVGFSPEMARGIAAEAMERLSQARLQPAVTGTK